MSRRNVILHGDALEMLRQLPDHYVQCCITSPPYYALRDYGIPEQIGLEETPQEYIAKLVQVFREVRRVLRPDGTLWLNIGDTYANDGKWGGTTGGKHVSALHGTNVMRKQRTTGFKPKNLMMIPARLAIALQDDGWILRSDIIWHKPTAMPESVADRPTTAHEHIFLLAKSERYFYDAQAIAEPSVSGHSSGNGFKRDARLSYLDADGSARGNDQEWQNQPTRNRRSVWTINTQPYPEAHFAVMPPKLVEPCVLAGTGPKACEQCGAAWQRITTRADLIKMSGPAHPKILAAHGDLKPVGKSSVFRSGLIPARETAGWQPACSCPNSIGSGKCIVLDPFAGSGTVPFVALQHNRDYLGIELNASYIEMAQRRIAVVQSHLWSEVV